ncbi:MAG TPA: polymer-forming cytoskeletal protein [Pseudomonadales bacterium]|nr:polymer-forming cytoskeletal protein [Pseudomonadales bacterium]
MSDKYTTLTPELYAYMLEQRSERDPVLERIARHNETLGMMAVAQIAPDQGAFLTLLTSAIGARAAIEVGTLIVRGGTLRGSVVARELIEIHEGAKVHADITAPEIDIAKGSLFDGRCTMAPAPRTSDPG